MPIIDTMYWITLRFRILNMTDYYGNWKNWKRRIRNFLTWFGLDETISRFIEVRKEIYRKETLPGDVEHTILHGSCWIFSPVYLEQFEGLCPDTFLYMEEDILKLQADYYGFSMRYITLRLKNGEIRQNYYFFADLAPGARIAEECAEGRLEWVPVERVLEKNMPHTAYYMLKHYLETGRYTDTLYGGVTVEDAVIFTPLEEF